jgi:MYXO-CTERM domain-containing protein
VYRFVAALVAFAFLTSASAALAAGPTYVSEGGLGVLARDGKTRYVAVPTGNSTAIERVRIHGGSVSSWAVLRGSWGIPAPTYSATGGEGLSRDGEKLIVGQSFAGSPSKFAVIDTRLMRVVDRFTLNGDFGYDALSPDASTLYLIQHVDADNTNRYVVRAYDLQNDTLRPGRIADKTQLGWVMEGSALTRATSAEGRWVYTLYQRPGGYPFIHALDTVSGIAHCTGLPWHGDQRAMVNLRLTIGGGDGRTLAVHWKSGRPWLELNTASWRLTHVQPADAFPWRWVFVGAGGAAVALLALGALVVVRRRHPREAVPVAL